MMKNRTSQIPVMRALLQKNEKKIQEWTFAENGKVTVGYDPKCSIWVPDTGAQESQVLAEIETSSIMVHLQETKKGHVHVGPMVIPIQLLHEAGILGERRKTLQLKEGVNINIPFGKHELRIWKSQMKEEDRIRYIPSSKFTRLIKSPKGMLLALIVSFLMHGLIGGIVSRMPNKKPEDVVANQRRYQNITVNEKNAIVERLREKDIDISRSAKAKSNQPISKQEISQYQGFIQAVTKKSDGKTQATGFESLFATQGLGADLDKALDGSNLGDLLAKERTRPKNTQEVFAGVGNLGEANVDALRLEDSDARVDTEISRAKISGFSSATIEPGQGELNRTELTRIVNRKSGQLQDCYERALIRRRSLSGKIVLRIKINPSGKADNVNVESDTIGDSALETCIVNQAKSWDFPKPKGGSVMVKFPFVFSSASARG